MAQRTNLLIRIKNILREVRFGNFSNRLPVDIAPQDKEFVIDFNNMLESLQDREIMLSENRGIFGARLEYMKTLLDMLNEGIISISNDFKILSVNKIQAKWLKIPPKKLLGLNIFDVLKKYTIYDENSILQKKNYEKFFKQDKTNKILSFEIKNIRMTFSITIKKFLDKDKNINYFIVAKNISSDIKLQKLKDTFLATLAHDLKVPIIAEEKVLKLLSRQSLGKTTPAQAEALENILSNNKEMQRLVNTLLDVYKLEEGVFKINKTHFNIKNLINSEIQKIKFIASETNVRLKFCDNCDKDTIYADEAQIGRVIMNLLSNAINFAPQKSEVKIELYKHNENIYIEVTDKGIGILPENISHIFDRYYTKKYRKVGTGLGLYLSKEIVRLHGGDIKVKSVPNKKTAFTVQLPIS